MANGNKRVFKTKKKLSGGRSVFRKWNEWEEGDYIIGKYVGMKEDNYEKPNWLIEVEEAGADGSFCGFVIMNIEFAIVMNDFIHTQGKVIGPD